MMKKNRNAQLMSLAAGRNACDALTQPALLSSSLTIAVARSPNWGRVFPRADQSRVTMAP